MGWLTPAMVGGGPARSGSNAHQSRPPRASVVRSNRSRILPSGQTAPAAILEAYQARMAPFMSRREAEAREAASRLEGLARS